ncbi:MAG: hypothetical protein Q9160_007100 [Pyrenula sp. 1 TL-2023]
MASSLANQRPDKILYQVGDVVECLRGPQNIHDPPMRAVIRSVAQENGGVMYGIEYIPEWACMGGSDGDGKFATSTPGAADFLTYNLMHTWYFKVVFRKNDYIRFTDHDEGWIRFMGDVGEGETYVGLELQQWSPRAQRHGSGEFKGKQYFFTSPPNAALFCPISTLYRYCRIGTGYDEELSLASLAISRRTYAMGDTTLEPCSD